MAPVPAPHAPAWIGLALTLAGDVAAVLLLTGYVHLIWTRRRRPLTAEAAADAFLREHGAEPDARGVDEVLLLADGRTALLRLAGGALGVVSARGRGWTTRVLHARDVRRITGEGAAAHVALRDYAHPRLSLRFPSVEARTAWLRPLEARAA